METVVMRPCRKFLGPVKDFENKLERNFQKAHLYAYLQGRKTFKWGWIKSEEGLIQRGYHLVQQDVSPIPLEAPTSRAGKRRILRFQLK